MCTFRATRFFWYSGVSWVWSAWSIISFNLLDLLSLFLNHSIPFLHIFDPILYSVNILVTPFRACRSKSVVLIMNKITYSNQKSKGKVWVLITIFFHVLISDFKSAQKILLENIYTQMCYLRKKVIMLLHQCENVLYIR